MHKSGPSVPMRQRLREPFRDANFRSLLLFLGAWTVAANLAAPFITVYLMQQLGFPVGTVTSLWVTSQLANALTLYLWGRLSDRLSNKAILAVALPVYFTCVLSLCFVDEGYSARWQLGVLYVIHILMGVATGGIALATGNLGLKLAPQGEGTVYLAAIGLVSAVSGGAAPIVAGVLAEAFQASQLSAVVRFSSPGASHEMAIVSFAHWEFLFAISAMSGLYVLHALSRVSEGREVSERQVVQQFALEAWRSVNSLSSTALGDAVPVRAAVGAAQVVAGAGVARAMSVGLLGARGMRCLAGACARTLKSGSPPAPQKSPPPVTACRGPAVGVIDALSGARACLGIAPVCHRRTPSGRRLQDSHSHSGAGCHPGEGRDPRFDGPKLSCAALHRTATVRVEPAMTAGVDPEQRRPRRQGAGQPCRRPGRRLQRRRNRGLRAPRHDLPDFVHAQQLRQHHRRIALPVEHVHRHAIAAKRRQGRADRGIAAGPVGAQQGDVVPAQVGQHLRRCSAWSSCSPGR